MYDKMKHAEAVAIAEFVSNQLQKIYPKPRFFGKWQWQEKIMDFEIRFAITLEMGENNVPGAIWHFFEQSDHVFLCSGGMRELADHIHKDGADWVYRKPGEEQRVIYG